MNERTTSRERTLRDVRRIAHSALREPAERIADLMSIIEEAQAQIISLQTEELHE